MTASRYAEVRARSVALVASLSPEDCLVQAMPDVSPAKWHLGHTTWFFEKFILGDVEPAYDFIFNSYYEAVGPRQPRPQRGVLSRPALDEVLAYRRRVDERMAARLDDPRVTLGLHHEEQHQELLLVDVKYNFFQNPLRPAYARAESIRTYSGAAGWLPHDGGLVDIGHTGAGFAFDNETPRHRVHLEPFEIASRPVTNAEYAAFIADRGYERPELWLSDGWAHVQEHGWQRPLYWLDDDAEFTLAGVRPRDPDAAVEHVSFYEADAYARWAAARLPTEAEWETLAPTFGHGALWEHTASPYAPYPGFRPLGGALGEYNGKFMCNQMVLRGGSRYTPPGHARATYRNFFYPHQRWNLQGLRLARDAG